MRACLGAIALMLLAACEVEPPPYRLLVAYEVPETAALTILVDGEQVSTEVVQGNLRVEIERTYESYEAARDEPALHIEAVRNGVPVWSLDQPVRVCGQYEDDCGPIIQAWVDRCFDDQGEQVPFCSLLACFEPGYACGPPTGGR